MQAVAAWFLPPVLLTCYIKSIFLSGYLFYMLAVCSASMCSCSPFYCFHSHTCSEALHWFRLNHLFWRLVRSCKSWCSNSGLCILFTWYIKFTDKDRIVFQEVSWLEPWLPALINHLDFYIFPLSCFCGISFSSCSPYLFLADVKVAWQCRDADCCTAFSLTCCVVLLYQV